MIVDPTVTEPALPLRVRVACGVSAGFVAAKTNVAADEVAAAKFPSEA